MEGLSALIESEELKTPQRTAQVFQTESLIAQINSKLADVLEATRPSTL
jgi:hypothetical protein